MDFWLLFGVFFAPFFVDFSLLVCGLLVFFGGFFAPFFVDFWLFFVDFLQLFLWAFGLFNVDRRCWDGAEMLDVSLV